MKLPKYFKKVTCETVLIGAALLVLLYSILSLKLRLLPESKANIARF